MAKQLQVVVFKVANENFGVAIDTVHEILRMPEVTAVPDAPDFFEGVINLRGRIIPVIDLRRRLARTVSDRTRSARVLIVEQAGKPAGLQVDAVTEVLKLAPETVEAPPEMISSIGADYVTGVAKVRDRLIILIDLNQVLDIEEMKKAVATAYAGIAERHAA